MTRSLATLTDLVAAVRQAIDVRTGWTDTSELVADQLRTHLPGPEILTPDQRLGRPDRVVGHLLHAEPDGAFSILGLVWRPGQTTRIHDQSPGASWACCRASSTRNCSTKRSTPLARGTNPPGEVSGFAPPGDIHRIRNVGDEIAISLHIYGTDITRVGSSARRYYN
jgi:predicted metal-dependent enzyme (double-stranded beta helix superfamily)